MYHNTRIYRNSVAFISWLLFITFGLNCCLIIPSNLRFTENFGEGWKFHLGDIQNGEDPGFDDSSWRQLQLPHDWSIEGEFSSDNPATPGGGALPGGIGWYRKNFRLPDTPEDRLTFIAFDGVYRNSEVWINGQYLGKRPYGYSSFQYELTPYLKYGDEENVIVVKVDNSQQPNSRWYSGSGIYRNVWLIRTGMVHVDHWGTFVTTPETGQTSAKIVVHTKIRNDADGDREVQLTTTILDGSGRVISRKSGSDTLRQNTVTELTQEFTVDNPQLWSVEDPVLYRAYTEITAAGKPNDNYETSFGIRSFRFDKDKGFFLNGKPVKIKGVCNHHDLGCLGAAVSTRAIERQLKLLKEMGCNAIRTSHNPPAPELLTLCDQMGFLVMDEAFDMWRVAKTAHDYHLDFDEWGERDLADMVLRDRNHPAVILWSIGNEIMEQWERQDSSSMILTRKLAAIVRNLDDTRPVTSACNGADPDNPLIRSGALDVIGFNYHIENYADFPQKFPGQKLVASETESALATRGSYDMPSDSIRRWPVRWDIPFTTGNPDYTCSSYDNCSAPWGSTHEETWREARKYEFVSGVFTWTGFDYLGEPTPYDWPARSSYFGIIDLAGFPKDAYYLMQSLWTDEPVLHLFPHWNWENDQIVDVWAYTNLEEVELFLNGTSQGVRKITADSMHAMWRLQYTPGTLRAVGRRNGTVILTKEVKTAGEPAKIMLETDRDQISADGMDLAFLTARIVDRAGVLVPHADNMINFSIRGDGKIAGVDNGLQTSHEPFQADHHKAFNGLCLAVIRAGKTPGAITVGAASGDLEPAVLTIKTQ